MAGALQEETEQRLRDFQREYVDFLDDGDQQGIYSDLVRDMIEKKNQRLIVNVNDLRRSNPERAHGLLSNCFDEVSAFQRALKEYIGSINSDYAKEAEDFFVGFEGSFGSRHVTSRTLAAHYLGNMVCLEGIITKCSLVRPKVAKSVHYCEATGKTIERTYTDLTSLDAYPSTVSYPTQDEDGNLLQTEFGLCKFKHHQVVTVEEMAAARHFIKTQGTNFSEEQRFTILQHQFEMNPSHPLIKKLNSLRTSNPQLAILVAEQLFANSMVSAGLVEDPRTMLKTMNELLETALEKH